MKLSRSSLAIAALLLVLPGLALANSPSSDAVGQVLGNLLSNFTGMISKQPFAEVGKRLLQMLLLILIAWKGLRVALDTGSFSMAVAELVNIAIIWGIASFFMEPKVQQQFVKGFDDLAMMAAQATGSMLDVASPAAAITDALGRLMDAAMKLYMGTPTDPPAGADAGLWATATSWLQEGWASLSSGDILFSLANLLFRVFLAILVLITGLIYAVTVIWTQVMVNVALVVAPFFVPWLLWEASAFLFHSWLKFLIVCGVQKVVGALMFGLTASMIDSVTAIATKANATPVENFYYYAATFLLVAIMALMMAGVTTIANGLVSGMPTSGFKPGPASLMNPAGGATRGGGALQKGASQAASGAMAGARAAVGGARAFDKAIMGGQSIGGASKAAAQGAWAGIKGGGGSKPSGPSALPKAVAKGGE